MSIGSPRKGIIVDANPLNIKIGRWLNNKSKFICQFLTLNNIKKFIKNINVKIDLLSLDIDGNDYYLMKKLIKLNPKLVACEYNPAFFLRPITVKYRKYFDRTKISKEWLYYGCSLKGWEIFMKKNKYSMVKISKSGVNAFFIKNDLLKLNDKILTAKKNFIDFKYPFQETHKDQWNKIKHFNFKIIN